MSHQQYDDDYGDEEFFDQPEDDSPEVDYLYGDCQCGWRDSDMFWEKDKADKARQVEKMKQRHADSHPDCKLTPHIRSY